MKEFKPRQELEKFCIEWELVGYTTIKARNEAEACEAVWNMITDIRLSNDNDCKTSYDNPDIVACNHLHPLKGIEGCGN